MAGLPLEEGLHMSTTCTTEAITEGNLSEHRNMLLGYALRRFEDPEDLVQDTLVKAWRKREQFRGGNLTAWLFTLLHHEGINAYRYKNTRVQGHSIEIDEEHQYAHITAPSAEDEAMQLIAYSAIGQALKLIPKEMKECFLLKEVYGYQCHEIASMRQIPIGTVVSRLFRAKQKLREVL